jgi:initiation factor 1A
MVKNTAGGNKAKGFARKGASNNKDKPLRVSENINEMYAMVENYYGNSMCDVMCMDGEVRMLHIRGKFKGRGKRDNVVDKTSWLLVGIRDYETVKEGKKQNCDLLEVYNDNEKNKLRTTVTNVNWKKFNKNNEFTNEDDNNEEEEEEFGFEFADQQTQEYMDLMDKLKKSKEEVEVVSTKDEDWIDMNEI